MDEKELLEDVVEELFDEIERATKDAEDYVRHDMSAEVTQAYALGLMRAVKMIRDKVKKNRCCCTGATDNRNVKEAQTRQQASEVDDGK